MNVYRERVLLFSWTSRWRQEHPQIWFPHRSWERVGAILEYGRPLCLLNECTMHSISTTPENNIDRSDLIVLHCDCSSEHSGPHKPYRRDKEITEIKHEETLFWYAGGRISSP